MTERVVIGDATLILGDARDVIPTLPAVDALVCDPPYGIGESAGKAKTRTSGLNEKVRHQYRRDYGESDWDNETADDMITAARAISKHQIIFGGNYYDLPPTTCWLVWDKMNGATDFADCELAWTNLKKAVRRLQFLWNGCMRRERHIERTHPTQKPVGVMEWCLQQLPAGVETVLDPCMGSGTTGVACVHMGLSFVGIERDPEHFRTACRRIEEAQRQPSLLTERAAPPVQMSLIGGDND